MNRTTRMRALLLASFVALPLAMGARARGAETAAMLERSAPAAVLTFNVYLPLSHRDELSRLLAAQSTPGNAQYRHWLTPDAFDARFGADKTAIAAIATRLRAGGLTIVATATHGLTVQGPAAAVEATFRTELHAARFIQENGVPVQRIAAMRPLVLPAELARAGAIIPAFDTVIHMSRHSRVVPLINPRNRSSSVGPYWFTDLKQAYTFPSYKALAGAGVHIGILMTGDYQQSDMTSYFNHEGLNSPAFFSIPVFGGAAFSAANSTETHLDLQQSGGMAPQAQIALYNIPDLSDESVFAGLTKITRDNIADVVSMSFGGAELSYTPAYSNGTDYTGYLGIESDFFQQGNAQGITFVASSGDYGSSPIPAAACFAHGATSSCGGFVKSVEIPASSPDVTGVGGTNLVTLANGTLSSAYKSEAAFGDPVQGDPEDHTPATGAEWASGGGTSIFFAQPSWQAAAAPSATFREVPDLALHMGGCPSSAITPCGPNRSADVEIIGGRQVGTIGTSASAPDFAGLVALVIQAVGQRIGNANPVIYQLAQAQAARVRSAPVFRKGIAGNNGAYNAGASYNMVLGNGTVIGNAFISTSAPPPAAGVPGSKTNP